MPLFISEATLKSRLRATDLIGDALVAFEECVSKARTHIVRRLGATRVDEIVAETPGTVTALVAADVETALVRLFICQILPNAVMDAAGDINRRWNEEAPFRELPTSAKEKSRMEAQIESDLAWLAGDIDGASGVRTFVTDRKKTRRFGKSLDSRWCWPC
jgi:hypothetical protein